MIQLPHQSFLALRSKARLAQSDRASDFYELYEFVQGGDLKAASSTLAVG